MANQTLTLNVSDEMKLENDREFLCEEPVQRNCILLQCPTHVETVCFLSKKAQ